MQNKKNINTAKDPTCLGLYSKEFPESEFLLGNRKFTFLSKVKVPDMEDLIDLKYFLREEIHKVVFTKWNINSVVFVDPTPATSACLIKYIYTDFGQIKYQTAFYVGDSAIKKVWLIR